MTSCWPPRRTERRAPPRKSNHADQPMGEMLGDFWRATDYHRFPGGQKKLRVLAEMILREFTERPRVLDVGCGNGSLSFPIAAPRREGNGVRRRPRALRFCQGPNQFGQCALLAAHR